MINHQFTNVDTGKVTIGKYSQLGCNCVVFPEVAITEGVTVGAMFLKLEDLPLREI